MKTKKPLLVTLLLLCLFPSLFCLCLPNSGGIEMVAFGLAGYYSTLFTFPIALIIFVYLIFSFFKNKNNRIAFYIFILINIFTIYVDIYIHLYQPINDFIESRKRAIVYEEAHYILPLLKNYYAREETNQKSIIDDEFIDIHGFLLWAGGSLDYFGIKYTESAIIDPWGNPYILAYDFNGDGFINIIEYSKIHILKITVRKPYQNVCLISLGADGVFTNCSRGGFEYDIIVEQ